MKLLLETILTGEKTETSMVGGIQVLLTLLTQKTKWYAFFLADYKIIFCFHYTQYSTLIAFLLTLTVAQVLPMSWSIMSSASKFPMPQYLSWNN